MANYGGKQTGLIEKNEGMISIDEILLIKNNIIDKANKERSEAILTSLPLSFYSPEAAVKLKSKVCGLKQSIGLLPDENISICGIGELQSELKLGKATPDSITKIWRENNILKTIREDMPIKIEGVCQSCTFKYICCGCCAAQNYVDSGSFFSSYYLCEQLYNNGLFPKKYLIKDI
jgi:radical SAM protein with 4Fe4S-binding SPASM domain